jgi:hypothetical protein
VRDYSKLNLLSEIHNLRMALEAEIARREKAEAMIKKLDANVANWRELAESALLLAQQMGGFSE